MPRVAQDTFTSASKAPAPTFDVSYRQCQSQKRADKDRGPGSDAQAFLTSQYRRPLISWLTGREVTAQGQEKTKTSLGLTAWFVTQGKDSSKKSHFKRVKKLRVNYTGEKTPSFFSLKQPICENVIIYLRFKCSRKQKIQAEYAIKQKVSSMTTQKTQVKFNYCYERSLFQPFCVWALKAM